MPNWVYNRVHGSAKVCKALLSKGVVDFNKVLPEPSVLKDLDTVSSNRFLTDALKEYCFNDDEGPLRTLQLNHQDGKNISFKEFLNDCLDRYPIPLLIKSNEAIEKYGTDYWYDWRCQNWGCKWNGHQLNEDPYEKGVTEIEFETPWSPPEGIIREIAKRFPNEDWVWHADEESCAFSIDIRPDGSGGVTEEEVFPEYYTPYIIDDEKYFRQEMEGMKTKDEILGQIKSLLPEGSPRDIVCDEKAKTITVSVYDWDQNGGDEFFTTTFEGVDFNG